MQNINNILELLDAKEDALTAKINFAGINKPLYDCNIQEFGQFSGSIDLNKIQDKIFEAQSYKKQKPVVNDSSQIRDILAIHQKDYVSSYINKRYGGLGFDTGAGKTLTILEMIRIRLKPKQIVLYIVPKNVFGTIADEIEKWTELSYVIVTGNAKNKIEALGQNKQIYIINYESLLNIDVWNIIINKSFTVCILDECHKIGNYKNKTTKKLLKNAHLFKSRWVMSGTMFSKTEDIYSIITFLDLGLSFGNSYWKFLEAYTNKDYTGFRRTLKPEKKTELQAIISSMVTTVKIENVFDMPEKIYKRIDVILTGADEKAYLEMLKESVVIFENDKISSVHKVTQINYLRQITGGSIILKDEKGKRKGNQRLQESKLQALMEYIKENNNRVVIVASFIFEIFRIQDLLCEMGFTVGIICGRVKQAQREEYRQQFSNGELDFLILQSAAGIGIDGLQKNCKHMYFYSRSYSYKDNYQIEARLFRQGLKYNMLIVDFVSWIESAKTGKLKPTIDSEILNNLENKKETAHDLIKNTIKNYKEMY